MKNRRFSSRVTVTALLALALTLSVTGVTLAWLVSRTSPIVNTFALGVVTVDIPEEFNDTIKSNVQVENPYNEGKNVPAYVRVALIPTWTRDADGEEPVGEPASLSDLDITWGDNDDWITASDGYYYYKHILEPGATSEILIKSATVNTDAPGYVKGYHMNLQVIADGVQAYPSNAVESVWPAVNVVDGELEVAS